jgi:hypothetical protein
MSEKPSPRDPRYFGRIALALSLLPWMAWALMRSFRLTGGFLSELLKLVLLLAVPAALTVSVVGLFSDARKSYAVTALAVTLVYALTFLLLSLVHLFRFVATH